MSIFAIADTHLSLQTDKSMHIFSGWEDYTSRLEQNWRKVVTDDDYVILPGDISWGMQLAETREDFAFLHALPGKKILLKGNHDYWWSTASKIQNFFSENGFDSLQILYNNAFEVGDYAVCGSRGWFFDDNTENAEKVLLREAGRLRRSIEHALTFEKELLVFLHYPPVSELQVCEQMLEVLTSFSIKQCYFGHVHGEKTDRYRGFMHSGIHFSLISADFLRFCPKLIRKF